MKYSIAAFIGLILASVAYGSGHVSRGGFEIITLSKASTELTNVQLKGTVLSEDDLRIADAAKRYLLKEHGERANEWTKMENGNSRTVHFYNMKTGEWVTKSYSEILN